jgi:hypothetical protein
MLSALTAFLAPYPDAPQQVGVEPEPMSNTAIASRERQAVHPRR